MKEQLGDDRGCETVSMIQDPQEKEEYFSRELI